MMLTIQSGCLSRTGRQGRNGNAHADRSETLLGKFGPFVEESLTVSSTTNSNSRPKPMTRQAASRLEETTQGTVSTL